MLNIAGAAISADEVSYKEGSINQQGHEHVRQNESQQKKSAQ